jgi:hypothetical protein
LAEDATSPHYQQQIINTRTWHVRTPRQEASHCEVGADNMLMLTRLSGDVGTIILILSSFNWHYIVVRYIRVTL